MIGINMQSDKIKKMNKAEAGKLGGLVGGLVGGKSTSEAKATASRENGKRGGRPLKEGADPKRRERYLRHKRLLD